VNEAIGNLGNYSFHIFMPEIQLRVLKLFEIPISQLTVNQLFSQNIPGFDLADYSP
jgi:hypothetical protein